MEAVGGILSLPTAVSDAERKDEGDSAREAVREAEVDGERDSRALAEEDAVVLRLRVLVTVEDTDREAAALRVGGAIGVDVCACPLNVTSAAHKAMNGRDGERKQDDIKKGCKLRARKRAVHYWAGFAALI
jgi:hypothetical protein